MHYVVLVFAWITPAAIAGVLGWTGTWGTGSAFGDYLIPIPVAGGVFHVPSFLIAAGIILANRHSTGQLARYLPVLAFVVLTAALSLMIDFDRLNAWLFTNYDPSGSPLRLDSNPLLLFIASDAFWVGAYALMRGFSSPARSWFAPPLVPAVAIAISAVDYHTSGPAFELGGVTSTGERGEEIHTVFTSASYDEAAFLDWTKQRGASVLPWQNVNTEHVAVLFSNDMQAIKWGRFDQLDNSNTIATVCLYEEDQTTVPHPGYFDCFAERNTVEQEVAVLIERESTGLGRDIDDWYARLLLCDNVDLPEDGPTDIALIGICRGVIRSYPRSIRRFRDRHGESSEQVTFVRAEAVARGLIED